MRLCDGGRRRRPWRGWVGRAALVAAGGLAACGDGVGPLPPDAERFTPPAVYARWWAMTAACSGTSGDLAAVRWYRAPGRVVRVDGQEAAAYWSGGENRIVLTESVFDEGAVVRHEMLHALLRTGGHPGAQFRGTCAALVTCQGGCVTEDGPWRPPRPDYAVLPPDSLDVGSEAELLPREADGERWLALRVAVANPSARAALIAVPGGAATPPTFGYDVRGPVKGMSGAEVALDAATLFFQPGETKRWLFEFRVASELAPLRVPPGTHLVRGGYARRWAAYDTVEVSP